MAPEPPSCSCGQACFYELACISISFLTEKKSFAEEKATRWLLQSRLPMLLAPRSLFKNIIRNGKQKFYI